MLQQLRTLSSDNTEAMNLKGISGIRNIVSRVEGMSVRSEELSSEVREASIVKGIFME